MEAAAPARERKLPRLAERAEALLEGRRGWYALLLALVVLLAVASRTHIWTSHVEVSDFAADSVLVLKAQAFGLWVGNYSGLGYNQPGPAILYVLAAGEIVFDRLLHMVPSPLSAQMLAVLFYNVAWLLVVLAVFRRTLPRPLAAFATAAIATTCTFLEPTLLGGLWFPQLYVFPFAAFLVALTRVVRGSTDSLWFAALAAGFLVNGHAWFLVIVPVMLVCALGFNLLLHGKDGTPRFLAAQFLHAHWPDVRRAIVVVALFLLPLFFMTAAHFPGPLADYVRLGTIHWPRRPGEAFLFTASCWGGLLPFLAAMAACAVALSSRVAGALRLPELPALAAVMLAATAAMLLYAACGVDAFESRHVAYFYFAVPALFVATVGVIVLRLLGERLVGERLARWVAWAAVAAMLVACYVMVSRAAVSADYNQPAARDVLREIEKHAGQGRTVLDVELAKPGSTVAPWSLLVGAQALAARQGKEPFCIERNWHIVFTRELRCTPSELLNSARYKVSAADAAPSAKEAFRAGGLAFQRVVPPDLLAPGGQLVASHADAFSGYLLGTGWAELEGDHVWSVGPEAVLWLPVPAGFTGSVMLDLQAYLPRPTDTQDVQFVVDNQVLGQAQFAPSAVRKTVEVRLPAGGKGGAVKLQLRIRQPVAPKSVDPQSQDPRPLGVAVFRLWLERR